MEHTAAVISDYLEPNALCDWKHRDILNLSNNFRERFSGNQDLTAAIYHFVRDNIRFKNISPHIPASEVLKTGAANCFGKAKLQISLLRASGIPAGFKLQELVAEKLLPFFTQEALEIIGDPVQHIFCMVYLEGSWLRADATFNAELLRHLGLDWKMAMDWNAGEDRGLPEQMILRDLDGPFPAAYSPDQEIPRVSTGFLEVTNRKVEKLWMAL